MLARKEHDKDGTFLPEEWRKTTSELFNSVYEKYCRQFHKEFDVYGMVFNDELLISISFLDLVNPIIIPITFVLSADLEPQQKPEKILSQMIDASGIFIDDLFEDQDWDDYTAKWEVLDYQGQEFHYQITRENVALTFAADKLLADNGGLPEEDEN